MERINENIEMTSQTMSRRNSTSRRNHRRPDSAASYVSRASERQDVAMSRSDTIIGILTIASVLAGGIVGVVFRPLIYEYEAPERLIMYLKFPSEIFVRLLKSMVLPLIASSLVVALAGLSPGTSGRLGARAVFWFVASSLAAYLLAMNVSLIVRPQLKELTTELTGRDLGEQRAAKTQNITTVDLILDVLRSIAPANVIEATFKLERTELTPRYLEDGSIDPNLYNWHINMLSIDNMNLLGVVTASAAAGVAVGRIGEAGRPITELCESINDVIMDLVNVIMFISPIGFFSLTVGAVLDIESVTEQLPSLALYVVTTLLTLLLHGAVTLPLLYSVLCGRAPMQILRSVWPALLTAFSSGSGAIALAVNERCMRSLGVDERVVRFVLPLGTVVNMDGMVIVMAMAGAFAAQLSGAPLDLTRLFTLGITASAVTIGTTVPNSGAVRYVLLLESIGVPAIYAGFLLSVHFLFERSATPVSVLSDSYACAYVYYKNRAYLRRIDQAAADKHRSKH